MATRLRTRNQRLDLEIAQLVESAARRRTARRVGEWVPVGKVAVEGNESAPSTPKLSVAKPKKVVAALRFLDLVEVEKRTNRKKSTIYAEMAAGTFPKQVKITGGGRRVGWLESEVMAWMQGRVDQRNAP